MDFIAQHGSALTFLVIPPLMMAALVVHALCIVRKTDGDALDL